MRIFFWISDLKKQLLTIGLGLGLAFLLRGQGQEDVAFPSIVFVFIALAMVLSSSTVIDWIRRDSSRYGDYSLVDWLLFGSGFLKILASLLAGLLYLNAMLFIFGNAKILSWLVSLPGLFFSSVHNTLLAPFSISFDSLDAESVVILMSLLSVSVLTIAWLWIGVMRSSPYQRYGYSRDPVISLDHHWGGFGRGISGLNASKSLVMLILTITIGFVSIGTIYGTKREMSGKCADPASCPTQPVTGNEFKLPKDSITRNIIIDLIANSYSDQPDDEVTVKSIVDGVVMAMPNLFDTDAITSNLINAVKTELEALIINAKNSSSSNEGSSDDLIQMLYLNGEIARLQQYIDDNLARQQNNYAQELRHITHLLTLQKFFGVNLEFRNLVATSIEQAITKSRNPQKSRFNRAQIEEGKFSITQFDIGFIHNSWDRKKWTDTSSDWVNEYIIKVLSSKENKGESGLKIHHAFIWGQTDKSGKENENLLLSKRRILSVFNELCKFSNVAEGQTIIFYGLAFGEEIAKSEYEHSEKMINVTLVVGPASIVPPNYTPKASRIQIIGDGQYECGSDRLQQVLEGKIGT